MSFSRIIALRKNESVAHGGALSKRATVRFDASQCRGILMSCDLTRDPAASTLRALSMPEAETKSCGRCGTPNPGTANFCFHCGWPFARPPLAPAPAPPAREERASDLSPMTERIEIKNPAAEELRAKLEELAAAQALPEPPPPPEDKAPFTARLFIEEGAGAGTTFPITTRETLIGVKAQGELSGDPFAAPRAAPLLCEEERIFLREEGSKKGVYLKLRDRDPGRLKRGDLFTGGEGVLRYGGPADLAPA